MTFLDAMHVYFRGEKLEAALFILPVGLLFLGMAYGAWRSEHGGFQWAVVVPSVLLGLVLVGVGASVAARTPGQVAGVEAAFAAGPEAAVAAELPRMRQVMVLFSRTVPTFGALALIGLGLRFGVKADWAAGLGAVLVAAGGAGLLIDGFAERRAEGYVAALEALAAESGAVPRE